MGRPLLTGILTRVAPSFDVHVESFAQPLTDDAAARLAELALVAGSVAECAA